MARFMLFLLLPALVGSTGLFPKMRQRVQAQKKMALFTKRVKVVVPPPMDAGADGFPVLPAVEKMLGGAALTLKTVSTQANNIAGRMAGAEKQSELELARQKSAFEANLKKQEIKNQAVKAENQKITVQIESLKKANVGLRKHAKKIRKKSLVLRNVVRSLESKMGMAKKFAHKSMLDTDDSKKTVLDVLHPKAHKGNQSALAQVSDDDDAEDDDDNTDEDEEGTSLIVLNHKRKVRHSTKKAVQKTDMSGLNGLDVSGLDVEFALSQQTVMSESPDAILNTLSKDINTLMTQRKESVTNLKNLFIRDFRAGAQRHMALLNQQKVLAKQRDDLLALQTKLKEAVAHLKATHKHLGQRLKGLGQFLQKLAHVANSPEVEVPRLLENLPHAVSIAPKKAM